jgi:hypothetical protein
MGFIFSLKGYRIGIYYWTASQTVQFNVIICHMELHDRIGLHHGLLHEKARGVNIEQDLSAAMLRRAGTERDGTLGIP